MEEDRKYWVGFNMARGIGPARLQMLLAYFGDAASAWHAPAQELVKAGLSEKLVEGFLRFKAEIDLDLVMERFAQQDIQVLTWEDEAYPRRMREIDSAPPVLYARGSLKADDDWAVAVVGTRRVTSYGRQVTADLVAHLARNGVTVVSGLARGVDTIVHQSALQAGGRTIAVLGSGVDHIYPPENRRLASEMLQNGAILSDYPPGTTPEASNFPPRNRIISGLSLAVVVIEASRNSGALITADFALNQGREVLAVPGNITAPQSRGTNWLIQQGARPLLEPRDVLDLLNLTRVTQYQAASAILPANKLEAALLELVRLESMHVDEMSVRMELPVNDIVATLALMELKGMVRQVGGMHYTVVREDSGAYEVEDFQE